MSSGHRVSRFLPSDPQFLLEYIDAAPSDESDSELDWYDDEQDESNDDNECLDDTSIDAAPASSHTRVCNNLPSTSTSVQSLTSSSQNFSYCFAYYGNICTTQYNSWFTTNTYKHKLV